MSLTITKVVYEKAKDLLDQGKVNEAWQVLGGAGDNYALNAAKITDKNNYSLSQTLVKETWENTVGIELYNQKFDAVAVSHLNNYLDYIKNSVPDDDFDDVTFLTLPDTGEIETSYGKALQDNGISASAAIDGIINTATGNLPVPGWTKWLYQI
ncbi:MAG: hypothetical protein FJ368_06755 [Pelagibacterales bacterium]|nr:hypothetical protein [Pelagibacterales bacterium]